MLPMHPWSLPSSQSARSVELRVVMSLSYASPLGGRVPASLVVPALPGPLAGVLLAHGSGPAGRRHLLPYALDLAPTGAVALLIDAPYIRQRVPPVTFTPQDAALQVQHIVDLRRAIDLLVARPDVDPRRLAFIGHSHGAAMGGLLAGVEDRIAAYALAAGDGGLVAHFGGTGPDAAALRGLPADVRQRWLALMTPIEPLQFIGRAAPAAVLFQAALQDEAVPVADAAAYAAAGSEPKTVRWYDTGHGLDEAALREQVDWLAAWIDIDPAQYDVRHGCGQLSCRAD